MDDDAGGLRHCRRRHASADADIDQLRLIVDYAMIAGGAGNGAARFYICADQCDTGVETNIDGKGTIALCVV